MEINFDWVSRLHRIFSKVKYVLMSSTEVWGSFRNACVRRCLNAAARGPRRRWGADSVPSSRSVEAEAARAAERHRASLDYCFYFLFHVNDLYFVAFYAQKQQLGRFWNTCGFPASDGVKSNKDNKWIDHFLRCSNLGFVCLFLKNCCFFAFCDRVNTNGTG